MNSLLGLYGRARQLKRVDHLLPRLTSLPLCKCDAVVDYLQPADFPHAYQLVQEAADRGDNVGQLEFPSLQQFNQWLIYNDSFTFREPDSGELKGFLGVGPCLFGRSTRPCLASLTQVRSADWSKPDKVNSVRDMINIGQDITRGLRYGFTGCVTSVFSSCTDTYLQYRQEGFTPCAVVPRSGHVSGYGVDDSAVVVKDIDIDENEKFVDHDAELQVNMTPIYTS